MCVKAAEVALDNCSVGGSGDATRRASDGVVAMCDATCSLEDCAIEWSSNVGVLAHVGSSEATVHHCTLRHNFIASGVDDGATLALSGNCFVDNVHGAVFVGRDAGKAEVELCNNSITGMLWLGPKSSLAKLTERDNLHAGPEGGGGSVSPAPSAATPSRASARPGSGGSGLLAGGAAGCELGAGESFASSARTESQSVQAAAAQASLMRVAHPQQGAVGAEVHAGSRVHARPLSSEIEEPPPGSSLEMRHVRRKLWTPSVG